LTAFNIPESVLSLFAGVGFFYVGYSIYNLLHVLRLRGWLHRKLLDYEGLEKQWRNCENGESGDTYNAERS